MGVAFVALGVVVRGAAVTLASAVALGAAALVPPAGAAGAELILAVLPPPEVGGMGLRTPSDELPARRKRGGGALDVMGGDAGEGGVGQVGAGHEGEGDVAIGEVAATQIGSR